MLKLVSQGDVSSVGQKDRSKRMEYLPEKRTLSLRLKWTVSKGYFQHTRERILLYSILIMHMYDISCGGSTDDSHQKFKEGEVDSDYSQTTLIHKNETKALHTPVGHSSVQNVI